MYCIHRQYRRWSTSKNFFLKGHQGAIAVVTNKCTYIYIVVHLLIHFRHSVSVR